MTSLSRLSYDSTRMRLNPLSVSSRPKKALMSLDLQWRRPTPSKEGTSVLAQLGRPTTMKTALMPRMLARQLKRQTDLRNEEVDRLIRKREKHSMMNAKTTRLFNTTTLAEAFLRSSRSKTSLNSTLSLQPNQHVPNSTLTFKVLSSHRRSRLKKRNPQRSVFDPLTLAVLPKMSPATRHASFPRTRLVSPG